MERKKAHRLCWSIAEASEEIGVSRAIVRREIREGRLRAVRIGRRIVVPVRSLDRWLTAAQKQSA